MLKLGDTAIPYHEDFRMYITTKLPNPHYTPEVATKLTLINFTLSPRYAPSLWACPAAPLPPPGWGSLGLPHSEPQPASSWVLQPPPRPSLAPPPTPFACHYFHIRTPSQLVLILGRDTLASLGTSRTLSRPPPTDDPRLPWSPECGTHSGSCTQVLSLPLLPGAQPSGFC